MMEREIIIDMENAQERRVAILEDKKIEEYYIERTNNERHAGNVYNGKVVNIVPGIQAAFIDVGLPKNGFLHASDVAASALDAIEAEEGGKPARRNSNETRSISELLKVGQEIIVQVIKGPISTKGVRLTANVSLPGRFLVLLPNEKQLAVSRKISQPEERKRLRDLAGKIDLPDGCGLIVRTAGEGCSNKAFANDAQYLVNLWKKIKKNIEERKAPVLVHRELDLVLRIIRDSFSEDISRIVINNKEEFDRVLTFVNELVPGAKKWIELYKGKEDIFDKLGIQNDIDKTFRRSVWLKCGGHIVIDQTEALIAIDVNSGRHTKEDNLEATVTKTNLEAADEVARQLRLRNIGGLVVIDFIDMKERQNQREVLLKLQAALRKDKARSSILPISEFGLVEMTRQRVKQSIHHTVYDECPYCKGRGLIKSILSMCIEIQRGLKNHFKENSTRKVRVEVHPIVMDSIIENIEIFKGIEENYAAQITMCSNEKIKIDDFKIFDK